MKVSHDQREASTGQGRLEYAVLIGLILFILASVYLLLAPELRELN